MLWHKNSRPILQTRLGRSFLYLSLGLVVLACATLLGLTMIFSTLLIFEYTGTESCVPHQLRSPKANPQDSIGQQKKSRLIQA
jgi:hypothetical protein